jgi:hypothetical protein
MNKHFRTLITLFIGVTLFTVFFHSCRDLGDNYSYDDVNGIQLRADAAGLSLTNKTVETVYYMAVEEVTFTFIDWIMTCETSRSVQSGSTIQIPYSQVTGYKKGCQVVVVWWHCSGTNIYQPGSWRTAVCKTP